MKCSDRLAIRREPIAARAEKCRDTLSIRRLTKTTKEKEAEGSEVE
jgi:hypothetical protein